MANIHAVNIPAAEVPTARVPAARVPAARVSVANIPAANIPAAEVPAAEGSRGKGSRGKGSRGKGSRGKYSRDKYSRGKYSLGYCPPPPGDYHPTTVTIRNTASWVLTRGTVMLSRMNVDYRAPDEEDTQNALGFGSSRQAGTDIRATCSSEQRPYGTPLPRPRRGGPGCIQNALNWIRRAQRAAPSYPDCTWVRRQETSAPRMYMGEPRRDVRESTKVLRVNMIRTHGGEVECEGKRTQVRRKPGCASPRRRLRTAIQVSERRRCK